MRYVLASLVFILAIALLAYAWLGMAELHGYASAETPASSFAEGSLVEPVWSMFSPSDGSVSHPAEIAGNIRMFFLGAGFLGVVLLVVAALIASLPLSTKPTE